MRIAKALKDLPVGTPIEICGLRVYKGLVIKLSYCHENEEDYVEILFADGRPMTYYEEDLEEEQIMIVEDI